MGEEEIKLLPQRPKKPNSGQNDGYQDHLDTEFKIQDSGGYISGIPDSNPN